jgi:hypothetical protein
MPLTLSSAPPRDRGGWWGITFAVGLLVSAGMVSLPTAAQSGADIAAFYAAHRSLIIVQQLISILILVPWLWFAGALGRRAHLRGASSPRILLAAWLLAAIELTTNGPPLILTAITEPAPTTAHAWTVVEDVADAALFVTIALFALAVAQTERSWVRGVGLGVAVLTLIRAVASPLGVTALDAVAPLAFLAFVLLLSVRLLRASAAPARRARPR